MTWSPISAVNAYARYSQGSRASTSIELGCADPANPCSLPNALSSDPPLQQVVTDTWEAWLRGRAEIPFLPGLNWNADAFRAENHNNILFVSSVELGTGYFQNFAKTRREGFAASLSGRTGRITWGLDYAFLLATYQSTQTLDGSANDTSNSALAGYPGLDGYIYVQPGDRIPLIPKQTGKAAWSHCRSRSTPRDRSRGTTRSRARRFSRRARREGRGSSCGCDFDGRQRGQK